MEKETTAVEELIAWIELRSKQMSEFGEYALAYQYAMMETQARSLLPKEREQIEEAWVSGKETKGYGNTIYEDASDYFTQNYGKG